MALLDVGKTPEQPWGIIVSFKEEDTCRVLFVYPIKKQRLERMIEDSNEQLSIFGKQPELESWKHENRFGVALEHVGQVLAPRDLEMDDIINKVDCLKLVGQWFSLNGKPEVIVSIVFVLAGHCSNDAVEASLSLAKQVCRSLQSLERANSYITNEVASIVKIQDEMETEPTISPFVRCLRESTLLQSIQRIYDDIIEYGNNVLYLDRHIQLTLCLESKSLLYCTLLPRTISALHEMLDNIEPFHTLLFVEEMRVMAEQNPLLATFIEQCTPDKSFEEIRLKMRCSMDQLMRLVRNVVQWGRGVIIFPTTLQNSYTVGPPSATSLAELAHLYDELYPLAPRTSKPPMFLAPPATAFLAEVLEFFSPAVTLEEFYVNAARFLPRAANTETFVFLLKTGLVMQLHIHIELIEPPHLWVQENKNGGSEDVTPRIKTLINNTVSLEDSFKKYTIMVCSHLLNTGIVEPEVFQVLGYFICLVPYFLDCDYVEKIIYRTGLTRSNINRVIELFGPILFVFEVPAKLQIRVN